MALQEGSEQTVSPLLSLPSELLVYIVSLASSSDMATSPPEDNIIPHESNCMGHRELTITRLSANRLLRRLAIETWYDTHWYGAVGKLDYNGFGMGSDFIWTKTFCEQGKNILLEVDVFKGAQRMDGQKAMEKMRWHLSVYRVLRRVVVIMFRTKFCPDNGLVEGLLAAMDDWLAQFAREKVAEGRKFSYKIKMYKEGEW